MQINLIWDAAAQATWQPFRDAVTAAAEIYSATFIDPITINISVGSGDIQQDGKFVSVPAGDGEGGPVGGGVYRYSDIRSVLPSAVDQNISGAIDLLPSGDIAGQTTVNIWSAEEKAFGLLSGSDSGLDGAIGFSTSVPIYNLTSVALHELGHAMGRYTDSGDSDPSLFDLYRFSSAGQNLTGDAAGGPGYFSLDGGQTSLTRYASDDNTDFLGDVSRTVNDAFTYFYTRSSLANFSVLDVQQLEALGFHAALSVPHQGFGFLGGSSAGIAFVDAYTGDWGIMSPTQNGEAWHPVGPSSLQYDPIATGDFNGDGITDIAFRKASSGAWGFMSANPSGGETWHDVGPSSTAYSAIAVGDFNGDGASDIVFRNVATGDLGFMSVNASGGEIWHPIGPTSPLYEAVGEGDFNKDGVPDIAFYNPVTSAWGFMSVSAGGGETWHDMGVLSGPQVFFASAPYVYQPLGVGDFNGDGVMDLALRDPVGGQWAFVPFTGAPFTVGGNRYYSGPTSPAYVPVGVGDYNGDGRTDIAFRNVDTGDLGYMSYGGATGETWHPMGPTSTDYFAV